MSVDPVQPPMKPYEKPTVRAVTSEEAKLLLAREASTGNQDAKELLGVISEKGRSD
jgi:hypothetical protein